MQLKTIRAENVIISIVLFGLALGFVLMSSEVAFMGTQATTSVSGTVGDNIDCSLSTSTVSFGTITTSAISTAYGSTTVIITANTTAYLKVYDEGDTSDPGLYYAGGPDLIGSADSAYGNTAALSAGTEGYGIQATSTEWNMTVKARYDQTGDNVGGLELAASQVTVASSSAAVTAEDIQITHKAAVSSSNLAGSYVDSLTYTCATSI